MISTRGNAPSSLVGRGGLYLFALSIWLSPAGAYSGLALMMSAAITDPVARNSLRRDPMVRLALLFAAVLLIYVLWAAWDTTDSLAELWDGSWKWLRLFLFFPFVAWWLGGDERRLGIALLLALGGLLLKISLGIHAHGLDVLWSDRRIGFGLPVISFGLFCATSLLGLLVLASRWWSAGRPWPGATARFIVWCAALTIVLQGLITSQSRDAWIAALIVFPPVLILQLSMSLRQAAGVSWPRLGVALVLIAGLIGSITARNLDTIVARLHDERASWQALLAGELDKVPDGSIGYRVQMIEFGLHKWLEQPLLGWGPHSYSALIEQIDNSRLRVMPHLHNAYIETLLTFGILGALFFLYLMGRLCAMIWQSWRAGRLSADYALFLSGALGLQFIWCLASFGLNQVAWNFYFAMLAGAIYGYHMQARAGRIPFHGTVSDERPGS
ncbi:MAG: O-antigen ligase family protein [Gammaproteobacteria bacterium]